MKYFLYREMPHVYGMPHDYGFSEEDEEDLDALFPLEVGESELLLSIELTAPSVRPVSRINLMTDLSLIPIPTEVLLKNYVLVPIRNLSKDEYLELLKRIKIDLGKVLLGAYTDTPNDFYDNDIFYTKDAQAALERINKHSKAI